MRGYQSSETVLRWTLRGAVFLVFCAVSALILFLCAKGAGTLGSGLFFGDVPALSAIFGQRAVWDGIWPACAGTACLVLLTMLIATLPGVGCGIYLAAFCPPRRGRIFRAVLDVLAGTPFAPVGQAFRNWNGDRNDRFMARLLRCRGGSVCSAVS